MDGNTLLKIVIVAGLVVFGLSWGCRRYVFDEWDRELDQRRAVVEALRTKNDGTDRARAERDELRRRMAETLARWKEIEPGMPTSADLGRVFEDLKTQAASAGLVVEGWKDSHPPYKESWINESPLEMRFQGRFAKHLTFMKALSLNPRIFVVKELTLSGTPETGKTLMEVKSAVPVDLMPLTVRSALESLATTK